MDAPRRIHVGKRLTGAGGNDAYVRNCSNRDMSGEL